MHRLDNGNENPTLEKSQKRGKIATGILLVAAGGIWLAGEMGANIPHWMFSWEMLLIALGICFGAQNMFRGYFWPVPILVGAGFLIDDVYPEVNVTPFVWPVLIIAIGLLFIFRPKKNWGACHDIKDEMTGDNYIESTTVFGGVKKNIISKDFKGGEITCVFGGAEIDLSQADINGRAVLELTQVFGGLKIIIPSNWTVKHEASAILGGIEEKRKGVAVANDPNKVLVLKGTVVFGGVDIRSY